MGLQGRMERPIRLVLLGAGSHFTLPLTNDLIAIPDNAGGEIVLVDVDRERLELSHRTVEKILAGRGRQDWKIASTVDRREALAKADYVINSIDVGGLDCVVADNDIPLKYGVDQCIGDTLGPGGLFKALRTAPVWLEILKDCEALCPEALVLNYTNPMGILCRVAAMRSSMKVVGLCHSVQHTSHKLASYAEVPFAELEWDCAGINHLAWFTKLKHRGTDLYPGLKEKFSREIESAIAAFESARDASDLSQFDDSDLVRKDMCVQFGAFITESSGHLSEYLPYYRKSRAGRSLLRSGYDGESRFYASNWPKWRADQDSSRREILASEQPLVRPRSWEYASWIIEAIEKDVPYTIYGNVPNRQSDGSLLISNLPPEGCVEVPCEVGAAGVVPRACGPLPTAMAKLCASNMAMIELAAEAVVEGRIDRAIESLMLDPLTAAVCAPREIRKMVLEMFRAEHAFLSRYH